MILDLKDRIFVVKKWYETSSVTTVRRAFRRRDARFHGRNLPSERQIRQVVECFEKYGSVWDARKKRRGSTGRPEVFTTDQNIRRVRQFLGRKQRLSVGNAARSLGMTRYTVKKISRKVIGKRAFKPCKTERLTPSQQLRRVTMSRLLLAQPNLFNKLKHVWFTDESWLTTDGITQKNNQFYWALNKDAVKPVISQKYPIKFHVWAVISVYGVIGPYFFHRAGRNISLNQYTYQECVKWFIDQL